VANLYFTFSTTILFLTRFFVILSSHLFLPEFISIYQSPFELSTCSTELSTCSIELYKLLRKLSWLFELSMPLIGLSELSLSLSELLSCLVGLSTFLSCFAEFTTLLDCFAEFSNFLCSPLSYVPSSTT